MVKSVINNSLEELFLAIENSSLYQEYKQIANVIANDKAINKLIDEIKKLSKEATYLESIGDNKYQEIDKIIATKTNELNSNHIYQEYLDKMEAFNDELAISSHMIDEYIKEKV